MNEERRDKLAREHGESRRKDVLALIETLRAQPAWPADGELADGIQHWIEKAHSNGWNACYAEMLTTRKESEPRE